MNVDIEKAITAPKKLRKLLKTLSGELDPEAVHQLRTLTRKLEATVHALATDSPGQSRRLLKLMKPIRRSAGRVRDMDVLIANASSLARHERPEGVVRLLEHLAATRAADALRLHRKIKIRQKAARSLLKSFIRQLRHTRPAQTAKPEGKAVPLLLAQPLDHWPRITQHNLHEFRKGVKELRYILQVASRQDIQQMNACARVKDAAGDWHDWFELERIADSILEPGDDASLLGEIRKTLQEKLAAALDTANSLRAQGVDVPRAA